MRIHDSLALHAPSLGLRNNHLLKPQTENGPAKADPDPCYAIVRLAVLLPPFTVAYNRTSAGHRSITSLTVPALVQSGVVCLGYHRRRR